MRGRANTFDFIRLIAATLVLWSHQHALGEFREPIFDPLYVSLGGLGVLIFFAISGYLNTLSAVHHRSTQAFLFNRALRIYPALVVCVVLTVVLGFCITTNLREFAGPDLLSYVAKNATLLFGTESSVPAVFEGNPYHGVLNGSLWTLPYEVWMYVALAICFAVCRYFVAAPIAIFAVCVILGILSGLGAIPDLPWGNSGLRFAMAFIVGSFVAATQLSLGLPAALGILGAVTAVFAALGQRFGGQSFVAWHLLLTIMVISAGCVKLPQGLRLPIDISYGVYLYAWPVQQIGAALSHNFWTALIFSAPVTGILAILSALLIERQALRLKIKGQLAPSYFALRSHVPPPIAPPPTG